MKVILDHLELVALQEVNRKDVTLPVNDVLTNQYDIFKSHGLVKSIHGYDDDDQGKFIITYYITVTGKEVLRQNSPFINNSQTDLNKRMVAQ
jgi:hypothetical protein